MAQMFFFDEQIRTYLLQFTRMISLFEIEYGRNEQGTRDLIRVPVRYGDATRQAQTIMQQNSANSLPSTPLMTFYIAGLDYDRPRMQEPYHVNKMQVRQRTYDQSTDTYETTQGNAFTEAWNFGPSYDDERSVDWIIKELVTYWGDSVKFKVDTGAANQHEAHFLKLDCSKARMNLGWKAKWDATEAIKRICAWHKAHLNGQDMKAYTIAEIAQYQANALKV